MANFWPNLVCYETHRHGEVPVHSDWCHLSLNPGRDQGGKLWYSHAHLKPLYYSQFQFTICQPKHKQCSRERSILHTKEHLFIASKNTFMISQVTKWKVTKTEQSARLEQTPDWESSLEFWWTHQSGKKLIECTMEKKSAKNETQQSTNRAFNRAFLSSFSVSSTETLVCLFSQQVRTMWLVGLSPRSRPNSR